MFTTAQNDKKFFGNKQKLKFSLGYERSKTNNQIKIIEGPLQVKNTTVLCSSGLRLSSLPLCHPDVPKLVHCSLKCIEITVVILTQVILKYEQSLALHGDIPQVCYVLRRMDCVTSTYQDVCFGSWAIFSIAVIGYQLLRHQLLLSSIFNQISL